MQLENLLRLHFLEDHSNVILLGTAGLGKTHLACALGNAACLEKHAVLFTSAIDVVNRLSAAQSTHQLAREMKRMRPANCIFPEDGTVTLFSRALFYPSRLLADSLRVWRCSGRPCATRGFPPLSRRWGQLLQRQQPFNLRAHRPIPPCRFPRRRNAPAAPTA
jgi:hypothetical protein